MPRKTKPVHKLGSEIFRKNVLKRYVIAGMDGAMWEFEVCLLQDF